MSMRGIRVGNFGFEVLLTVTQDGEPYDISSYGTCRFVFIKPDGMEVEKTATFKTDGEDGQLTYTAESGLVNAAGWWAVYPEVLNGVTADLAGEAIRFLVKRRGG